MSSILKPVLGSQLQYGHRLTKGLVGFWLFNEGSGNTVFDLSGNGNAGIFKGGTSWGSGIHGSALFFDGVDSAVSWSSLPSASSWTICLWIRFPVIGSDERIFDSASGRFILQLDASGVLEAFGGETAFRQSSVSITVNQWYFIVASNIPSESSVRLYINGLPKGVEIASVGAVGIGGQTSLAAHNNGTTNEGQVDISSFSYYDRVLSAGEIALLHREPFGMFKDPDELALLAAATAGAPPAGTILPQITTAYMRLSA